MHGIDAVQPGHRSRNEDDSGEESLRLPAQLRKYQHYLRTVRSDAASGTDVLLACRR